jgi:hypothetical protein
MARRKKSTAPPEVSHFDNDAERDAYLAFKYAAQDLAHAAAQLKVAAKTSDAATAELLALSAADLTDAKHAVAVKAASNRKIQESLYKRNAERFREALQNLTTAIAPVA